VAFSATAAPGIDQKINKAVKTFVTTWSKQPSVATRFRTQIKIGNIDPRLPLKACSVPLDIAFQGDPLKQTNNTISVACKGIVPWRIFLTAVITLNRTVYVTSRSLSRGRKLTPQDLTLKELPVNKLRYGYYVNKQNIVGKVLKRNTMVDTPLYPNLLKAPKIISKGDEVMIVASTKLFSVKMKGKALSDGNLGQQIPVRNSKTKRIVRGTVIASGIIHVIL